MSDSLKLDISQFEKLVEVFSNPVIKEEILNIPKKKAVAAIVAQAISDNFNQEGPGWAPLKPETIRQSVSKSLKKKISGMSDEALLKHEAKAKKSGTPHRRILRRTGLLFNTLATPGYSGSTKGKTGRNLLRVEGSHLIYGTDLVYAGVHNSGSSSHHIPKREFMTVKKQWLDQLNRFILDQTSQIIASKLNRGSS